MNTAHIVHEQRTFFHSNATKSLAYRIAMLTQLKNLLRENESMLYEAIYKDFKKSAFETYTTELGFLFHEIRIAIKSLKKWTKPKRVMSDIANFPSRQLIIPEPLGSVLVIGAWNYPYQLSLAPVIAAIAAGNTVMLKPSEMAFHTSKAMATIINDTFAPQSLHVIEGGVKETTELLTHRFDKIFFTGSTAVGRIVYEAAAKHLTPVVLELGGKSPTFVLEDANINVAARRIVWAKFLNAGQTCIAPDYILVPASLKASLIEALKMEVRRQFSNLEGENYVQIINERNFDRLHECAGTTLISDRSKRIIAPTIFENAQWEDCIMRDEIFGPILPVITYENLEDALDRVKAREKPLACYVYTNSRKKAHRIIDALSFGGGAVNDSIMHLTNPKLPFGGVGASGMGSYHGKHGFDAFSHHKSMLYKGTLFELPFKYAPYSAWKLKLVKFLLG